MPEAAIYARIATDECQMPKLVLPPQLLVGGYRYDGTGDGYYSSLGLDKTRLLVDLLFMD